MTAATAAETAVPADRNTRRVGRRPGRLLALNLLAVATGLGVWSLLSVVSRLRNDVWHSVYHQAA